VKPRRVSRRELLLGVIAALLALIIILLATGALGTSGDQNTGNPGALPTNTATGGGGNGNGNNSTATVTPTSAPTSAPATPAAPSQTQTPANNGPLGTSCDVTPVLPAHWAGWQNHPTANTVMSRQELWATSHPSNGQPGVQLADYAGTEKVSAADMVTFVHDARCDGMSSAIEVSPFVRYHDGLSLSQLVSAVDGQSGLVAYVVGMNDLGVNSPNLSSYASAVGNVVSQVHSQSSKPVWCIIDKMTVIQAQQFKAAGCARTIVGYYPWQNSSQYGPVDALTTVGGLAQSVDGNAATAGIQTFSWWLDDQPDAVQLGFTAQTGGLPPVPEVHRMGQLAAGGGAHSLLGITLETSEDNFQRDGLCAAALRSLT
jgi:hypothetical protein